MFSFVSLMFSKDIQEICESASMLGVLVIVATVFVGVILIWLVGYMVTFMMEKRSKEFGTYLLIGMTKGQIATIFIKENVLLGFLSFLVGIFPGFFFQQVFTTIFYKVMGEESKISLDFHMTTVWTSLFFFAMAFLIALIKNSMKFRKMNIHDLMYMDKKNEDLKDSKKEGKKVFLFLSLAYMVVFYVLYLKVQIKGWVLTILIIGMVVAIYTFYTGLSAYLASAMNRKKKMIYKGTNIFLLRQFSSKMRTMRFTMGTLTVLFTVALLGSTLAVVVLDYQSKSLGNLISYDINIFSPELEDTFEDYKSIILENTNLTEEYTYHIYENGTDTMNQYLVSTLPTYRGAGTGNNYYQYDTYIKLSDYNHIRKMAGHEPVQLTDQGYFIQTKERLKSYLENFQEQEEIIVGEKKLDFQGCYTDSISTGIVNGADVLLVLPDNIVQSSMHGYYSVYLANIDGATPKGLQEQLEQIYKGKNHLDLGEEGVITMESGKLSFHSPQELQARSQEEAEEIGHILEPKQGTENMMVLDAVTVKDNIITDVTFSFVSIAFILSYLGVIFLCVSLTILSVQQLSDSSKYKFRYSILSKLGLSKKELERTVLKQLATYYFCPFIIAVILSSVMAVNMSQAVVRSAGMSGTGITYFAQVVLVFSVIYVLYFIITYREFQKNINS